MTYSLTSVEQRQLETEKTRKLVTIGIVGSIALHGIMFTWLNSIEKPLTEENKPIEFIVVQEPEIKPEEKPVIKPEVKPQPKEVVKPQPQPKLETVKPQPTVKREITPPSPTPPVAKTTPTPQQPITPEVVETNSQPITSFPSLPVTSFPSLPVTSSPLPPVTSSPLPSVTSSPSLPVTSSPQPSITQPQEVLTSNTLATNNPPPRIKPIENSSNNPFSNSFNSSTRVENSNSNSLSTVARVSEDMPVSSGRLTRSNNKTPGTINGGNGNQGGGIGNLRNTFSGGNGIGNGSGNGNTVSGIPGNIAPTSQSIPQPPQAKPTLPSPESIKCISNCNPPYPSELQGVEGKATVKVNLDSSGNVLGVSVVNPHRNGEVNRQALLAARQMRFSSPSVNNASVQVSINFTVAGSEFDRIARQKKEEAQRLAEEKERQARQAQLEQERL